MNFDQHPYLVINITFVCKRLFPWKLEYIFREIYCLHQVISLDNKTATRGLIFWSLFTTNVIISHVKIHVKSDAQKVLGK